MWLSGVNKISRSRLFLMCESVNEKGMRRVHAFMARKEEEEEEEGGCGVVCYGALQKNADLF